MKRNLEFVVRQVAEAAAELEDQTAPDAVSDPAAEANDAMREIQSAGLDLEINLMFPNPGKVYAIAVKIAAIATKLASDAYKGEQLHRKVNQVNQFEKY